MEKKSKSCFKINRPVEITLEGAGYTLDVGTRNCSFKTSLLQTVSSDDGFAKFQTRLRIIFAKLDLRLVVIHQVMA